MGKAVKNHLGLIEISRGPLASVGATGVQGAAPAHASPSGDGSDTSADSDDSSVGLTCREPPLEGQESSPETANAAGTSGGVPTVNQEAKKPKPNPDAILCCQGCGCYGMASEFHNETACGEECHEQIVQKKRE